MTFWSGEKLAEELQRQALVEPFSPGNIDCASYRLSVGTQAFVTDDSFAKKRPRGRIITVLGEAPDHTIRILPGQFAFFLTFETVRVPNNAIALISMRAKYKFQGLINVSGFHVDPGWNGKLLFTVYNAGSAEVVVERLEQLFLIVYGDLDRVSSETYKGKYQGQDSIRPSMVKDMMAQVFSPLMLQRKVEELQGAVTFTKTVTYAVTTAFAILIAVVGVFAEFAPHTLGVILGKTIQQAYEMKLKPDPDGKK